MSRRHLYNKNNTPHAAQPQLTDLCCILWPRKGAWHSQSRHDVKDTRTVRRSSETTISYLQNVSRLENRPENWKDRREDEPSSRGKARWLHGNRSISIYGYEIWRNLRKRRDQSRSKKINLRQHTHWPCNVGKLTVHKKKSFKQGTLLALFCVFFVDDSAFNIEDRDQLTRGLNLIYQHFTRYRLEMYVGKGKKSSKTECVFFPPPGFFRRKINLSTKNRKGKRRMLVTNTKHESYESR